METALRVIIIDDSEVDAELVFNEISKNYITEHVLVDNEHDLRSALNEKLWDLVLCDYSMPNFDPYKAVGILRECNLDIPLIVISGTIGEEKAIKLLKAGCSDCILKSNLTRLPGVIDREIKEAKTRKENKELFEKLKKYQILCDAADDIMLFIDIAGNIMDVNSAAIKCYGYSFEEILTKNIMDLRHISNKELVKAQMEIDITSNNVFETIHYRKDGSAFNVEVSSQAGVLDDKKVIFSVCRDITERKEAENRLIYLAYHDPLTGLYNRRYFEEEIKRLDTEKYFPLSIIMCDFDGLKLINDSFGHDFGDLLLKKAAEIIKNTCREDDIISRIGGDEFAVLLANTDIGKTAQIADQIKENATKEKVANIELSISYGYDTKKDDTYSIMDILANSENHMYRQKLYERSSIRSKVVDLIMNALFEKSDRESLHSNRVSVICQAIASKMNPDTSYVDKMRVSGLIHDIGKIGIDEKILNKAGRLDSNERNEIERHPEVGWRILSSTNEFSEVAQFVRDHHEQWNGNGYPNGIKGEAIPIEARIISVADAYDAMISERPYKNALSKEEAVYELKRCSGSQFAPEIVDVFVNQVLPYDSNFGGSKTLLTAVDKEVSFVSKPS